MIKSLLLLSALLGVNSMPVASNSNDQYYGVQDKQYQHTEDVGNTEVTYKYESNEVSSVDDLVVGNIYKCSIPLSVFNTWGNDEFFRNSNFIYIETYEYGTIYYDMFENHLSKSGENSVNVRLTVYDASQTVRNIFSYSYNPSYYGDNIEFIFQFTSISSSFVSNLISYIAFTDYNEVVSIDYTPPTTIFGHLAEVLGDNLYGGIPNVDNVIFSIGGQDITLKSWLVTSTCIVLAVVLITILCLFIRWLFKLFSNTILLR